MNKWNGHPVLETSSLSEPSTPLLPVTEKDLAPESGKKNKNPPKVGNNRLFGIKSHAILGAICILALLFANSIDMRNLRDHPKVVREKYL